MLAGDLVLGLDVGSTHVCAALARRGHEGGEIVAAASAPRAALDHGGDPVHAAPVIHEVLAALRRGTARPWGPAWLGVGASLATAAIARSGRAHDPPSLRHVSTAALARELPDARERTVLYARERALSLAGGGRVLSAVTACWEEVRGAVRAAVRAGLEVEDVVLAPLALGECVLGERERRDGVALLDVGGWVTTAAVFEGDLGHAVSVPLGGAHISEHLGAALGLPGSEADRLKLCARATLPDERLQAWTTAGERCLVSGRELMAALSLAEQRFFLELRRSIDLGGACSVVLAGGSSAAAGIDGAAASAFGMPVRVCAPPAARGATLGRCHALAGAVALHGVACLGASTWLAVGAEAPGAR